MGNAVGFVHNQEGRDSQLRNLTIEQYREEKALVALLMGLLNNLGSWNQIIPMQTTVTTKNMVTIPAALSRKMNITPGCRLEWHEPKEGGDEVRVRVIPTRGELARRLMGAGKAWSPERDAVAELVAERLREEEEQTLS